MRYSSIERRTDASVFSTNEVVFMAHKKGDDLWLGNFGASRVTLQFRSHQVLAAPLRWTSRDEFLRH